MVTSTINLRLVGNGRGMKGERTPYLARPGLSRLGSTST
jgi:hypothetical protein